MPPLLPTPAPTHCTTTTSPQPAPGERAQRGRRQPAGPAVVGGGCGPDDAAPLLHAVRRDPHRAPGDPRLQEGAREPGVVPPCPRAHAAGAAQMLVEGGE